MAAVLVAAAVVATGASALSGAGGNGQRADRAAILLAWDEGRHDDVFAMTGEALAARPLDFFLLTMRGFSAYQAGVSRIDGMEARGLFDDSVRVLRQALLLRESDGDPRIPYVLGKAYFQLGDGFADLAVAFLERAADMGHRASDIPEFLGLAHAALGDHESSVIAFARALEISRPSALLLLSMAQSYVALGEYAKARAYLVRAVGVSADSRVTLASRLLLADVLGRTGDVDGAIAQIAEVIEEGGDSAEARFRLGELHAMRGDNIRARAEWRSAVAIDPAHLGARSRLAL